MRLDLPVDENSRDIGPLSFDRLHAFVMNLHGEAGSIETFSSESAG